MNIRFTLALCTSYALLLSPSSIADDSPFAMSVIAGLESYPDSEFSSLSRGMGMSFIWDELRYQNTLELNKNYFRARATYYYERDSELYDDDRFRDSMDAKIHYYRPLTVFGDQQQYLLSGHARYEGHYNSQQLEEFEQLAVAGLSLNRRFTAVNNYDLRFTAALGYSEEEKDDDWPRESGGFGVEALGRSGLGYFLEWDNRYTFSHSNVQIQASLSRFDGRWQYDDGKFYVVNKLTFGVIVPLGDENNLLHFVSQYIQRDYEQDLIGFDDVLYRVGAEYIHYF
ncbi:hypothetical protein [Shewanella sp. OMA3-2]|uniref:hypothetical protein n=1 Tax=Shewanella sp. OMA3-2 TaxID=2908650 RepID=UPI001F4860CA|nr:hypothetical protein [Shewanella sp. OMA3-2]UJF22399.1 hypothetical protein L0B17_02955 [Shewanella sp. OMA3-2]